MMLDLVAGAPRPANDDLSQAEVIEALPFTTGLNTETATTEPDEDGCGQIENTVWYRYTPTAPGLISANTFGSSYDTVLAAYAEIGGTLISLACNDDAGADLQSQLTVPALPGVPILLQVGGYAGDTGDLVLTVF